MGAIVSRWRTKQSTIEKLEELTTKIKSLEDFKQRNIELQKKYIGSLLIYSILLYVLGSIVFLYYYFPKKWKQRLIYSTPMLVFPVLIWALKRFLHWYFVKRITQNDTVLEELKATKKQLLEEVMEKETYKKAKEILEMFDPEQLKGLESTSNTTPPMRAPQGQELRHRTQAQTTYPGASPRMPGAGAPTPGVTLRAPYQGPLTPGSVVRPPPYTTSTQLNGQRAPFRPPPGPPLPREILPRERTTVDRLVEYLVGDGPQNRYALICKRCHSHNGMALREEFEYISFRCCYCYHFNEAQKQRPYAPRIDPLPASRDSEDDSTLGNEDDDLLANEEVHENDTNEQGASSTPKDDTLPRTDKKEGNVD